MGDWGDWGWGQGWGDWVSSWWDDQEKGAKGKGKGYDSKGKGKGGKGKGKPEAEEEEDDVWRDYPVNSRERRLVARDLARLLTTAPSSSSSGPVVHSLADLMVQALAAVPKPPPAAGVPAAGVPASGGEGGEPAGGEGRPAVPAAGGRPAVPALKAGGVPAGRVPAGAAAGAAGVPAGAAGVPAGAAGVPPPYKAAPKPYPWRADHAAMKAQKAALQALVRFVFLMVVICLFISSSICFFPHSPPSVTTCRCC